MALQYHSHNQESQHVKQSNTTTTTAATTTTSQATYTLLPPSLLPPHISNAKRAPALRHAITSAATTRGRIRRDAIRRDNADPERRAIIVDPEPNRDHGSAGRAREGDICAESGFRQTAVRTAGGG